MCITDRTSTAAKKAEEEKAARSAVSVETCSISDTVRHKAFGTGVVLNAKPMGNDTLLEIAFEKAGTKKVMANFAKLTKVYNSTKRYLEFFRCCVILKR